jgi:DNA-binding MarR family transcriptional regulator
MSEQLNTNELAVLESLHGVDQSISQRELARRTGLSVGLINAVMKKLVHTGYVKTSHLNRRSVDYLLTPSGFAQTALKSYRYMLRTVREYRAIQTRLHGLVNRLKSDGMSTFFLHGEGDLAELVSVFFEEADVGELNRNLPETYSADAVVLNVLPAAEVESDCRVVDLINELGNGSSIFTGGGNGGMAK